MEDGIPQKQNQIAKKRAVTEQTISLNRTRSLGRLRDPKYTQNYLINCEERFGITQEQLLELFYGTDNIFYPDTEYTTENPNQTHNDLIEAIERKKEENSKQKEIDSLGNTLGQIMDKLIFLDKNGYDVEQLFSEKGFQEEEQRKELQDDINQIVSKMLIINGFGIDVEQLLIEEEIEKSKAEQIDVIRLQRFKQIPIESCGFSENMLRELKSIWVYTIGDLLDLNPEEISRIQRSEVLEEKIQEIKQNPAYKRQLEREKAEIEKRFDEIKGETIDICGLHKNVYSSLIASGITTIEQLCSMSPEEIKNIDGLEILHANRLIKTLSNREKFVLQCEQGLEQKEFHDCNFSAKIIHILERQGITTIQQLMQTPIEAISEFRGIGVKAIDEIKQNIEELKQNPKYQAKIEREEQQRRKYQEKIDTIKDESIKICNFSDVAYAQFKNSGIRTIGDLWNKIICTYKKNIYIYPAIRYEAKYEFSKLLSANKSRLVNLWTREYEKTKREITGQQVGQRVHKSIVFVARCDKADNIINGLLQTKDNEKGNK